MSFIDRLKRFFGGASPNGGGREGPDMISCEDALSLVYEFLDGELEDVSHEQVKAHFDVCQRCYPHLRLEESFRAALRRASAGTSAPPDLKARVADLVTEADEV